MGPHTLEVDLSHILQHTIPLWDSLNGSRIFLSGGTGFVGCWLLEGFLWANDQLNLNASVTVLTRDEKSFGRKAPHLALHPAVSLLQGDVRSFDFPEGYFKFVIHAAGEAGLQNDAIDGFDITVQGTQRMLDFARQCKAKAFLYTSSGAVYGKQPPEITHLTEDFTEISHAHSSRTRDSRAMYAEGKKIAESLCSRYASQFEMHCKIARCFAFAGPYLPLDSSFAIGNFVRDAMAGQPIRVTGDGTAFRSYLYSADLSIWLWTILLKGEICRPYNVGSEVALTISELAAKVAGLLGNSKQVLIAQQSVPGTPPVRYTPATQRARTELGLREWIGLDQAILSMGSWHRAVSR